MNAEEFGAEIRGIRKSKNMTLTQLGEKTGYTQAYLSMLENGKKGIPNPKTLKKISDGLGEDNYHLMRLAGYIDDEDIEKLSKSIDEFSKEMKETLKKFIDATGKGLKVNLKNLSNLAKDALESDSYKQYLRLEEKINNYEFDLFDLLDWDFMGGFDIYYKDKLLTDEQKEKVKLMLKTLLE